VVNRFPRIFASLWLSMLLIYMGAVPTLATCVGEDHDDHVVVAMAPDHCESDTAHTHEDAEHKNCFCPPEGCGPDDCTDLPLTWAAEPPSREDSAGELPAGTPAVAAVVIDQSVTGPVHHPEGPPGNPIPLSGQTCRFII